MTPPTKALCECGVWAENIEKLNAPLMTAFARNPDTAQQYDGAPFQFCPWCGEPLNTDALPQVVSTGVVRMGNLDVEVHVLDDGRRIISAESLNAFTEWLHGGDADEVARVHEFFKGTGVPDGAVEK